MPGGSVCGNRRGSEETAACHGLCPMSSRKKNTERERERRIHLHITSHHYVEKGLQPSHHQIHGSLVMEYTQSVPDECGSLTCATCTAFLAMGVRIAGTPVGTRTDLVLKQWLHTPGSRPSPPHQGAGPSILVTVAGPRHPRQRQPFGGLRTTTSGHAWPRSHLRSWGGLAVECMETTCSVHGGGEGSRPGAAGPAQSWPRLR